jgi:hypothetical protein
LTFLLDTNVISEPTKKSPSAQVVAWLANRSPDEVFFSAVTLAEVRYGIQAAPAGARKQALEIWFDETFVGRPERIIPIGFDIADAWGRLRRRTEGARRSMDAIDAFIAATAEVHGLTLVSRNTRHFEAWGGPVLNPWP